MKLILRELNESDEQAFLEGAKEWVGESPHWYSFIWPNVQFSEMLDILKKEALGVGLKPDRVPHTMLYAFLDEKIIGRVSVRHTLNDHLRKRGGHINYPTFMLWARPAIRNKNSWVSCFSSHKSNPYIYHDGSSPKIRL